MLLNTKKTALFLKSGANLPTLPDNYLEVTEPIVLNQEMSMEEFRRLNGKLNSNDSYVDICDKTVNQSITHNMRVTGATFTDVPEYAELLKIGGFDMAIDDTTAGEEYITFKNTQTPLRGSAIVLLDGYKHTLTGSVVADVSMNFPIGKAATIEASLQGFIDNNGVATSEAMPAVALNENPVLIVSCGDVVTADGVTLKPDNISISMGAEIEKLYAMGLKEFNLNDYKAVMEISFYPDNADYNLAQTKLNNQDIDSIDLKLGTDATGVLVNGRSVHITCTNAKAMSSSDSDEQGKIKRSFTYLLQNDVNDTAITIKSGFFA